MIDPQYDVKPEPAVDRDPLTVGTPEHLNAVRRLDEATHTSRITVRLLNEPVARRLERLACCVYDTQRPSGTELDELCSRLLDLAFHYASTLQTLHQTEAST